MLKCINFEFIICTIVEFISVFKIIITLSNNVFHFHLYHIAYHVQPWSEYVYMSKSTKCIILSSDASDINVDHIFLTQIFSMYETGSIQPPYYQ